MSSPSLIDAPDLLLSPADLKRRHGLTRERWQALLRGEAIPAYRLGSRLFARAEDVERWLEGRRYVPPEPGEGPHERGNRPARRFPHRRMTLTDQAYHGTRRNHLRQTQTPDSDRAKLHELRRRIAEQNRLLDEKDRHIDTVEGLVCALQQRLLLHHEGAA